MRINSINEQDESLSESGLQLEAQESNQSTEQAQISILTNTDSSGAKTSGIFLFTGKQNSIVPP